MPSHRFPILLFDNAAGAHTACMVDDPERGSAIAGTRSEAVEQIKELLQWRYKQSPWLPRPDFINPQLRWFKVDVRPEYLTERKTSSTGEPVPLRVPCVCGVDTAGTRLCAVPTMQIRFLYEAEESLEGLVSHHVQQAMKGATPQQLARHFPPLSVELDDVVILVPAAPQDRPQPPDLRPLTDIAEPLGARSARRMVSRPWLRDELVARLAQILASRKSSVVLVGESGTGKTAILAEAVRKAERQAFINPDDPDNDEERETRPARNRFWLTNGARLIAGMQYLGQWQERREEIISKLDEISGTLCVENLLELVQTGGEGPADSIAAFLMPYLQTGELRLVGEATAAELDACRRLLPGFAGAFTVLEVPAFTAAQASEALDQLARTFKQNLKVEYDRLAIEQIVRLFTRFMPYHHLPGKAAAFTSNLFERAARSKERNVGSEEVIDRFIKLTGLPQILLRDDLPLKFEDVVSALAKSVVGQDGACRAAAGVVTAFKAGLNDPQRPLGVLLFCGPTGVGKTELSKAISQFFFGHGEQKDRLIRLDMSEYAGPGAVARLIGSPFGAPTELIKRVRQQPFCVLLLDEIEKASPDIFDVLLGVFDEGRLTDQFGRLTTFRSALIIMTSNLGGDRMEPFGLSDRPASRFEDQVMDFFRPEFFIRIDAVVTFDPLSEQTIRQITIGELERIASREGLSHNEIKLTWTDDVVSLLCRAGYDRRYGVRPLQRTIESLVITPLSKFLLTNPKLKKVTLQIVIGAAGEIEFQI